MRIAIFNSYVSEMFKLFIQLFSMVYSSLEVDSKDLNHKL